jgi:hypothetical protein
MLWKATIWAMDLGMKDFLENKGYISYDYNSFLWIVWNRYVKWNISISHFFKSIEWLDISELSLKTNTWWEIKYKYKEKLLEDLLAFEKQFNY